jgi:hypothetical protein
MHPTTLLGCEAQVEADKSFWMHLMALLGCEDQVEAQVDARFNPYEIVLIMMQDRCTVCAERTIGLEIISNAADGTPG